MHVFVTYSHTLVNGEADIYDGIQWSFGGGSNAWERLGTAFPLLLGQHNRPLLQMRRQEGRAFLLLAIYQMTTEIDIGKFRQFDVIYMQAKI